MDATSTAAIGRASDLMARAHSALGLARGTDPLARYSIGSAIKFALADRGVNQETALEAFCHDEFERHGHRPSSKRSVFVPSLAFARALQTRTAYNTSTDASLIETDVIASSFTDALRPRSVALSLGVQVIDDLKGDVVVPRQDSASVAYWVGESVALTESEATFDSSPLTLAPQTLGVYSKISRLLLQQGGKLLDSVLASDVAKSLATGIDAAILNGSGTAPVPTGIANASGTNAVSGTSLGLAGLISAQEDVVTANAVLNRAALGWAAPGAVAALLAGRFEASSNVHRLWRGSVDTGTVLGIRALASQNMPSGVMIFGDFSSVLLLLWGSAPVQLEFSPFGSGFASGDVQMRVMLSANAVVRRPASFSIISGIT